jgi:oxygen-dependent protoporphyrinogen oxidase
MLGGVYNADVEQMSIESTFGHFRALERKHGSLINGLKERAASQSEIPALVSMRHGMGSFATAIADALTGEVRYESVVSSILSSDDKFDVIFDDQVIQTRSVIVSTPAYVTASLLSDIASSTAKNLRNIRYEGVGSVSLGYRVEDIPHALDAYGVVIPRLAKRQIDGITFASAKWENRAPEGYHLLRVFFGGPNTRDMLEKTDNEIVLIVRNELEEILGITAEPVMTRVKKLANAYPQYDVGHKERIQQIKQALPQGIELVGLTYGGVGIPDTVRGAKEAVKCISERLSHGDGA